MPSTGTVTATSLPLVHLDEYTTSSYAGFSFLHSPFLILYSVSVSHCRGGKLFLPSLLVSLTGLIIKLACENRRKINSYVKNSQRH